MTPSEKIHFTKLAKIELFRNILKKLTLNKELEYREKVYILEVALLFTHQYKNDNRYKSYREFAYYLILKYSLKYNDYKALYDFSVESGFYPITKEIIDKNLLPDYSINDILLDTSIETFRTKENYIEILEQNITKKDLLNSDYNEIVYVAPTSYGKSSIIIDLIKKYSSSQIKIGIIVPSKSLLIQTFKMIKKENLNKRLLVHDDMFDNDTSFISIFTQERALRLLNRNDTYFDILFIDEAHNLLSYNSRAILLSRLIKKNHLVNPSHKIIYLSPLIDNANSLKVNSEQRITKKSIDYNVKEPELYEYNEGIQYKYNRFLNELYEVSSYSTYLNYIFNNSKNKNFLYLTSPRRIEEFADEFKKELSYIEDEEIEILIKILRENVHEDFNVIDLLRKGILYIHGQMPDLIKEYLERKYSEIKSIKYIIANKVILEGINLPIDNLFILNLAYLQEKDIINLIGRVNRLNTIFAKETNQLNKLLPSVHFINSEFGKKMTSKIKKLRSNIFKDKVNNPLLESFDMDKIDRKIENSKNEEDKDKAEKYKERIITIIENENYLVREDENILIQIKKYCIEHEITKYTRRGQIYDRFEDTLNDTVKKIYKKIKAIEKYRDTWNKYNTMKKIQWLFINKMNVQEFEFKRLEYESTRKFYIGHIARNHQNSLKENIISMSNHFKEIVKNDEKSNDFYMGETYGDFEKETRQYKYGKFNVYVDLSTKDEKELINLAIIKLKMEDTFINFTLSRFVEMMYKYNLIKEEEYNLFTYGSEQLKHVKLMQYGLNFSLIKRLEKDNQLDNLEFDDYGNIIPNPKFKGFLNVLEDDFYKFQIEKYI